jgi:hypothetical protein
MLDHPDGPAAGDDVERRLLEVVAGAAEFEDAKMILGRPGTPS